MNAERRGEYRVLLAGPREWIARIRPSVAELDAVRVEAVETDGSDRRDLDTTGLRDLNTTGLHDPNATDCVVTGVEVTEPHASGATATWIHAPPELKGEDGPAGADWTIPLDGDGGVSGVAGVVEVVERERERDRQRRRFAAVFDDPDRFVALLDAEGTALAVNEAAREALATSGEALEGKRFWALPGLSDDATRRTVQKAVRTAADGSYASFETELPTADPDATSRYAFRLQPAGDRVVVQGTVRSEIERLEAELRSSEQLHRVTLNNMTDTVLVTNDDGEFTYVCPNVHFIFGYTAEEIHEMGTIDALLGEDLFDERRLRSQGVLTNVECTATDEEGEEHHLLVNVREVSIQEGSVLYSCRDVTARKQREQALTQLQETSRKLLYAETETEVATEVAADAEAALSEGGVALYRLDDRENVLYPTGVSDTLRRALGRLPEVGLDRTTCVSRAYVDGDTVRATDLDDRRGTRPFDTLADPTAIPLGEHGVLLVAGTDGDLDGVNEEVGELLAATAEAAFDRLDREREVRERDERLQTQNRRLTQANRVNEIIRDVDRALVDAESRAAIERAVCERLSTSDRFAFAWIGEGTARGSTVRPREWAGDGGGYLDEVALTDDAGDAAEPAVRTARDRSLTVVPNVADQLHDAEWGKAAVSRNFASVLSVPLSYDGVLFGTLTVYDREPHAFSETVRSVFEELGHTIGAAINAVQRKEALQSDAVFALSFRIRDPGSILFRLARDHDCTLTVESEVARSDDSALLFVSVDGADPAAVVADATSYVDVNRGETIRDGDGGLVGLEVTGPFITAILANHGATRRGLSATPDGVDLEVDVPDPATVRTVDELLTDRFDTVELRSQRKRTRDEGEPDRDLLTPRQEEVTQVAYHSGYFEPSREVSGRDVAETLDISHTAFYDHVRRVERKLFAALFEDDGDRGGAE